MQLVWVAALLVATAATLGPEAPSSDAGWDFHGIRRAASMPRLVVAESGLANGEKVHPGQFRNHYDSEAFSVDWQRVPYSRGGWESWSAETRQEHFPVLLEPQGRVYFAGAYLSHLTGWQAGAIESAWYQVEQLHSNAATA